LFRWARRAVKKDFYPDLAALVNPVQNSFFLTAHYFTLIVPIAQQPGRHSSPGRLSLYKCLWDSGLVVSMKKSVTKWLEIQRFIEEKMCGVTIISSIRSLMRAGVACNPQILALSSSQAG
jgi:hypothetical protein